MLAGLAGCAQTGSQQVSTQQASAPSAAEVPAETRPTAPLVGDWVEYGGVSAVPGVDVPRGSWIKNPDRRPDLREPGALANDGTFEVFDRPDGSLIGYYFAELGFASKELVDSGGYDPVAAIKSKYGCDVMRDMQCKIEQNAKNVASAESQR